ncbi:hypothetical protein ABEB36_007871 [Hypothenemus hampei]|uniref:Nicastrin n=1 Tax=Hypothenemus hampei TaxID=57062 RepID=A0ABD1EVE8_HYPHA
MLIKNFYVVFLIFISLYIVHCNADRIKDTMYMTITGSVACYRRMNATHQIGCSSKRGGSVGIIHYCDTETDLDFVLHNGTAGEYIPILPTKLFKTSVANKLFKNKDKISGLILHPNNEELSHFTHDTQCPNALFSSNQSTCPEGGWNNFGTGLLYADIPFPIFYVEDENQIKQMKNCFLKYNKDAFAKQSDRSLCALELKSFMYGTTNTPTCQRRSNMVTNLNPIKVCDPLGDSNVWGTLFPLEKGPENNSQPIKNFKYIILSARLDTTSLFEKTSGAESPITGLVCLLTAAKLLKEMSPKWNPNITTNVLFVLFNGETYDYIGSQRLLYDMERGEFPTTLSINNDILPSIHLDNITLFIELSQLSLGNQIYTHVLNNTPDLNNFIGKFRDYNPEMNVILVPNSLPPSSLHTFIRANNTVQGMVLADHQYEYRNPFYNSIYDNVSNIDYQYQNGSDKIGSDSIQGYVGNIALMLARSLCEQIAGNFCNQSTVPDLNLVDELFHCYLEDPNCKVHKAVQKGTLPKSPLSLYVGVENVRNFLPNIVALTLAWFTGERLGPSSSNCTIQHRNHIYRYYNMSTDIDNLEKMSCYQATVNLSEAVSPAFIIDGYDWSSNKYSSWSESSWNEMGVRMFLKPSKIHERITLAVGSITMILSCIIVYFIHSRSHILFDYPDIDSVPTNC